VGQATGVEQPPVVAVEDANLAALDDLLLDADLDDEDLDVADDEDLAFAAALADAGLADTVDPATGATAQQKRNRKPLTREQKRAKQQRRRQRQREAKRAQNAQA